MDLAICTINNEIYTGIVFSNLSSGEIERMRYDLVCSVCRQPAFFRKRSTDGKKACFGSSEHLVSCTEYLSNKNPSKHKTVSDLVNKILASNEILNLDFTIKAPHKVIQSNSNIVDQSENVNGVQKRHVHDPPIHKISKLNPAKALEYLMYSPSFSKSDVLINTGAQHPFKARNLFVNLHQTNSEKITEMSGRTWRGCWGLVEYCSKDWIRSGNVLIQISRLDQNLLKTIKKHVKISAFSEFVGCYILVFGKLTIGKENIYIKVDGDTNYIISRP